jgi:hypothetical protein
VLDHPLRCAAQQYMDRSGHPIDEAIRECKVPGAEGWRKLTPADPKARKADFGSLALTQSYWTIFLPERRRHTPSKKLSAISETDYTLSKGNVHLVWKLSRVGEKPEVSPSNEFGRRQMIRPRSSALKPPFEIVDWKALIGSRAGAKLRR